MDNNTPIFRIKRNDTLPTLQVSIGTRGNLGQKVGYDLAGVSGVTFTMIDECSNSKVYDQPAQITCSSGGTIQYLWQEGDTDTEGIFWGEFELRYNTGQKLSIPTQGGIKIEIIKDLDSF